MSIRFRIALVTSILMGVLLLAISVGVYVIFQKSQAGEGRARLFLVYENVVRDPRVFRIDSNPAPPVLILNNEEIDPFTSPGLYIQVLDINGTVAGQAPLAPGDSIKVSALIIQQNERGQVEYFHSTFRNQPWRVMSAPVMDADGIFYGTMQVAEPLAPELHTLDKLRVLLLSGTGIGLVATALGAFLLAGRSLRPLSKITTTARHIGQAGDLSQRIDPAGTRDEVQQLAETFNEMLQRLEATFAAERRFVSDASHELRTPLTALRGNADILLRQVESGWLEPADLKEGLGDIRDEAERMGRLVQNLLTLARADVGWRPEMELVHLDQVVADAARVATPLAAGRELAVSIDGEVDVVGNADQLKQLLLILLDNAFTYTPEDGTVTLGVQRVADTAEIIVRDSGPGISPDQLERIFDRFYRGELARSHGAAGAGLGLAIARWIVDCHNGSIRVDSTLGEGSTFTVVLPLTRTEPAQPARVPAGQARESAVAVGND